MEPDTDIIRQVYCEHGEFLTVRPWADEPDLVCLQTVGEKNQAFFGSFEIVMSPKMTIELGNALISCAEDITHK